MAKHFGTFPFNHGRVGGTVSTDRHGPYAEHGKDLVLIDISPREGQVFPLTKFVPWAAFVKQKNGKGHLFEQKELFNELLNQREGNPDEVDLEGAIQKMEEEEEIRIKISG